MGRRRHQTPATPSSMTEAGRARACASVQELFKRHLAMTPFPYDRESFMRAMFSPLVLQNAQRAKGIVKPDTNYATYRFTALLDMSVRVHFDEESSEWPTIQWLHAGEAVPEFIEWSDNAMKLYYRYERCKHVIKWLDAHATPGAVRYYFPALSKLLTTDYDAVGDIPNRFSEPEHVRFMLQPIRDASATIAGACFMPETAKATDAGRSKLLLTFDAHDIPLLDANDTLGERTFTTDAVYAHL